MKSKKELLSTVYYDVKNKGSYGSMRALYVAAKKINKKVTMKDVRDFFESEIVASRFSNAHRNFPRALFVSGSAYSTLVGDLADMTPELGRYNQKNRYINVVTDLFSRRIIGLMPQVTKTSAETSKNLAIMFAKHKHVRTFLTDGGREYLGQALVVYAKRGIKHQQTVGIDQKAQTVERAIQNIKKMLYKLMEKHQTKRWIDFLDIVKDHQNRKFHRILGMTPVEASKKKNQSTVFKNTVTLREMKNFETLAKKKIVYTLNVGDLVRIIRYDTFQKSFKGVWTNTLYRVVSRG